MDFLAMFAFLSQAAATGVTIDHRAVGCLVAERFPVLEARIGAAGGISRARVLFRAVGTPTWYFVEMRRERDAFVGVLPKPLKTTQAIEYYLHALDSSLREGRTPEMAPRVVESAAECAPGVVGAGVLASASVAVGSLTGGAAVPVGFSSVGILPGSVAGAAAGAAGGGGGGISTGAVLGIVGGAAAVAGGVAVVTRGDSSRWTGTAQYSGRNSIGATCIQTRSITLEMKEDGAVLSGKITWTVTSSTVTSITGATPPGCNPVGFTLFEEIEGSVNGSSVSFGWGGGLWVFTGTRTGSTMEGTLVGNISDLAFTGTWSVARQ